MPEIQSALAAARRCCPDAKLADARKAEIAKDLGRLQSDAEFLRKANDIHNIHYASKLEQVLLGQVSKICRELKVAEPKVQLPPAEEVLP